MRRVSVAVEGRLLLPVERPVRMIGAIWSRRGLIKGMVAIATSYRVPHKAPPPMHAAPISRNEFLGLTVVLERC